MIEFLVLLMVALGAGPVGAAIWNWSTTAGTNATADPSINWAEGMSPSSVNDSARAMMAVIAAWRNDISTTNTTGGTSTAYTLTTSEGVNTTPVTGQMLAFIAHTGNGASATLQVDGGNTYPLILNGAAVGAGTLVTGTPYRVGFNGTQWILEGGYGSPFSVPLGGLMYSTVSTPPNSSFVVPAGQCLSTTTYATYWAAIGSPASGACPGGQFAIIDHRGRGPWALDNIGGSAASRMTNAATGCGTAFTTMGATCSNGTESKTLATGNLPPYTPAGSLSITAHVGIQASVSATAGPQVSYGPGGSTPVVVDTQTFTGTAQGGTSTPLPSVSPVIGLYVYLRVL